MQRELKFRAWDTERQVMMKPEFNNYWLLIGLEGIVFYFSNGRLYDSTIKPVQNSIREYPYKIMQYTGSKAENGKEIYEGDIITGMNLENQIDRAVVRWDSVQWYPLAGHRALTKIAVIGNIYETPEYI